MLKSYIHRVSSYIRYYYRSKSVYSLHSPLLYTFYNEVFNNKRTYYRYDDIERERQKLLSNTSELDFIELGAGHHGETNKSNNKSSRKISDIARHSLSSKEQGKLLFKMINLYESKNILEFGTSLGISTSYLAAARSKSCIYTVEGNKSVQNIANDVFDNLGFNNIISYCYEFDNFIESDDFKNLPKIDLLYLDGNHSYNATMKYYQALKSKLSKNSIVILDDIYWSKSMTQAWEEIQEDKDVILTIDLYELGIVFFDPNISKQHVSLINYWKKPWQIGVFG